MKGGTKALIGERLYDLRKDKGLSQEELGKILNINKHSISSYERDKSEPPAEIKIRIAKFFNVSIDYLLGLTSIPNPYYNNQKVLALPNNFDTSDEQHIKQYINFLDYLHRQREQ